MKLTKFLSLLGLCLSIVILGACSLHNPDSDQMAPGGGAGSSDMSGMDLANGGDGAGGLGIGGDSSLLPGRPANAWTPIPGARLEPVYFAFDNSNIGSQQFPKLEKAAQYLKSNTKAGLIIEGNCDERGSAEYNIGLGERRALSSRQYLVNLGIPESRLQTISYGVERPADPGHNEAAWMKNRRDELVPANMN
jgi:peptidoglycan-associated lipoprotein